MLAGPYVGVIEVGTQVSYDVVDVALGGFVNHWRKLQ